MCFGVSEALSLLWICDFCFACPPGRHHIDDIPHLDSFRCLRLTARYVILTNEEQ
jgi:hypothetical protein